MERKYNSKIIIEETQPKFRDSTGLSPEQLTDPDYRLKQIENPDKGRFSITCSRCHHCR